VRGLKAITTAVFFKVTGWIICAAAKIALKHRKKAEKAASRKKTTGHAPKMRSLADLARRCQPNEVLTLRFLHRQRAPATGRNGNF